MSFSCGIVALVILLNTAGSVGESVRVTCRPQVICALRESVVNLDCSYSETIRPQQSFWFSPKQKAKWRRSEDPEDLAQDSDYTGRLISSRSTSRSTLTIRDLRERDSGEYHLMIITETGQKYSSATAVTVTVTDLQVNMDSDSRKQTQRSLNCSTSCMLTSKPNEYNWYRNGRYINSNPRSQTLISSRNPGSYSCSVLIPKTVTSSSVCVFEETCWGVVYSDRRVCALEGSSVDFPCTYSYPSDQEVTQTFWFYSRPKKEARIVMEEKEFAGRVEFLGDKERSCTLRIKDLRKSDSGEYFFRFFTNTSEGRFSGKPGVILNVTDLQVRSSPSSPSGGQAVTLTCSSTCTLPNNPTYTWYHNREPVNNKPAWANKLYLNSASPEEVLQYSCTLGGSERNMMLKLVTVGVSVFLALTVTGWILMRRGVSSSGKDHRSTEEIRQCDDSDHLHYSSLIFKQHQSPPQTSLLPVHISEERNVEYAVVNFSRPINAL